MRAVVNVATGPFVRGQERLRRALDTVGFDGMRAFFRDRWPPGSPSHQETPYAFKAFAIADAWRRGASVVLWADASVLPVKSLDPLFERIERDGYWVSNNGFTTGEWCADSALGPLGITREQSWGIPHPVATAFGLNLADPDAMGLFREWFQLAMDGAAFRGPWTNRNGEASNDPRVRGHRHDQTALGVLVWRHGWKLTDPPNIIAYRGGETADTLLIVDGAY